MIRVHAEVERSSRSAVERGDFMKTLQEALKTGESIDIEFKSWIKASNMRERISLAVDELIAFANRKGGTVYLGVEDNCGRPPLGSKYTNYARSEQRLAR